MAKQYRKWLNPEGRAFVMLDDGYLSIGDCSRHICLEFYLDYSWSKDPLTVKQRRKCTSEYKALLKKLSILREAIDTTEVELEATYKEMLER